MFHIQLKFIVSYPPPPCGLVVSPKVKVAESCLCSEMGQLQLLEVLGTAFFSIISLRNIAYTKSFALFIKLYMVILLPYICTSSKQTQLFLIFNTLTTYSYQLSFVHSSVSVWNHLPHEALTAHSINSSKSLAATLLL